MIQRFLFGTFCSPHSALKSTGLHCSPSELTIADKMLVLLFPMTKPSGENGRQDVASLHSKWTAPFEAPKKHAPIKSIASDKEKADYETRNARDQTKKLEKVKMKLKEACAD